MITGIEEGMVIMQKTREGVYLKEVTGLGGSHIGLPVNEWN